MIIAVVQSVTRVIWIEIKFFWSVPTSIPQVAVVLYSGDAKDALSVYTFAECPTWRETGFPYV